MELFYRGELFYVRDSRQEGVEGGVYRVNRGEFQPVIFTTTCQGEAGWKQIKDWLDEHADELNLKPIGFYSTII